jgi:hypothetical protein
MIGVPLQGRRVDSGGGWALLSAGAAVHAAGDAGEIDASVHATDERS